MGIVKRISIEELADEIYQNDFVFLGEEHFNQVHLDNELKIIDALSKKRKPMICLEHFENKHQKLFDDYSTNKIDLQRLFSLLKDKDYDEYYLNFYSSFFVLARKINTRIFTIGNEKEKWEDYENEITSTLLEEKTDCLKLVVIGYNHTREFGIPYRIQKKGKKVITISHSMSDFLKGVCSKEKLKGIIKVCNYYPDYLIVDRIS